MSKFMELNTVNGSKVLINIDKILDVFCKENGNCYITLAARYNKDYYYEVENYEKIKETIKIMEATR